MPIPKAKTEGPSKIGFRIETVKDMAPGISGARGKGRRIKKGKKGESLF